MTKKWAVTQSTGEKLQVKWLSKQNCLCHVKAHALILQNLKIAV